MMTPSVPSVDSHHDLPDAGRVTHDEIDDRLPDRNEKDALQGSSGTPSDSNRYVTESEHDAHTHDHGALTGLSDDDHPAYPLANGGRVISTLSREYNLVGEQGRGTISDDTYFDILAFTAEQEAATDQFGVVTGTLTIIMRNRETGGGVFQTEVTRYHITVCPTKNSTTLTGHQTTLSNQEEANSAMTTTLQFTGATTTYIKLQAKVTHANFDNDASCLWFFQGVSHAGDADYEIVPSVI